MSPTDDGHILNPSHLAQLAEDMASSAVATAYAGAFLGMLPGRVQRIAASLADADYPAAMDAVLSLKVNARMLGALRIEQECLALERRLRHGQPTASVLAAAALTDHAAALTRALTAYLSMDHTPEP